MRVCISAAVTAILVVFAGQAVAQSPTAEAGPKASATSDYQPVEIGKVIADLPAGTHWLVAQYGVFCQRQFNDKLSGGPQPLGLQGARETLSRVLKRAGLNAAGDTDRLLFGDAVASKAEYVISGVVVSAHVHSCLRYIYGDGATAGEASVTVEWKVFSKSRNAVVAVVSTDGAAVLKSPTHDSATILFARALENAAEAMAQRPEIRRALRVKPEASASSAGQATPPPSATIGPTSQPPIALLGSLSAGTRGMDASADAVVLISVPDAHGSGFLVSKDGYLLTDAHVVGNEKSVQVRWADGVEAQGTVVRLDKGRDVALVWTDPRGHAPLPLRRDAPVRGDTVFAIGAPLDKALQGTVVRGIISARRVIKGYDFLQSDANTNHGMSGGPLLDEKGRVVALVEAGLEAHDVPEGINFFTPIDDALKYLSLTPQ